MRKSQEANVSEKEKYEAKKEGTKKKGRKKDNWEGLRWVKKGPHEKAHVERECKKEASIQANQGKSLLLLFLRMLLADV